MPISTIFSIGFRTYIPVNMEAMGNRLFCGSSDFDLPVNSPKRMSGSMEMT